MKIEILFEPRDCWIGLYWDRKRYYFSGGKVQTFTHLYFCLIPCLPIRITIPGRIVREV